MRVKCCLLAFSDLPVMPSYWFVRVTITLLHISCNHIIWWTVWLEKMYLESFFQMVHGVIGLFNSLTPWSLALMWVKWTLSVLENKISCALSTNVIPSSWFSYCQLGYLKITNMHFPTCINAICGQPPSIFDESLGSPREHVRLILFHWATLQN